MRIFKLAHQLTTLAFVNGKNHGFTIIDKKTHFSIFNRFCLVFAREKILSAAPLKIVPSQAKFKKCSTNHPHHLLGVDDDRIFRYS